MILRGIGKQWILAIGALSFMFVVFALVSITDSATVSESGTRDTHVAQVDPGRASRRDFQASSPAKLVYPFDGPFPNAEKAATLGEAQSRLSFSIPLPQQAGAQWNAGSIYVSPEGAAPEIQQLDISFSNGYRLSVRYQPMAPRWEKVALDQPKFRPITVGGHQGVGADPGTNTSALLKKTWPHPGSVSWWRDNLYITLYSDTEPMAEISKVAQTFER